MDGTTTTLHPDQCISDLSALGQLRVWSVVITIFGDAVADRGGTVPAVALQPILDRLNIRPEAMRVALHRLVKEGWITRDKRGRQSFYSLSKEGREAFLPATQRIYATGPNTAGPWPLIVLPPSAEPERARLAKSLRTHGFFPVSPHLYLGDPGAACPKGAGLVAAARFEAVPDWARDAIAPASLRDEYNRLVACLTELADCEIRDPLDAVALRILVIHQWRRCLLRHPDVPAQFFPNDWQGETCRKLVLNTWKRLSKPANPWLDNNIGPATAEPG